MPDIVIVGAGLIGASTAYALSRRNADVLVLDRNPGPGEGASFANGGMLTPSMADPWNAPGIWKDLIRWIGRDDAPMLLHLRQMPRLALWGLEFLAASRATRFAEATENNIRLARFGLNVMTEWERDFQPEYDGARNGTMKIYRSADALEAGMRKSSFAARLGVLHERLGVDAVVSKEPGLSPIAGELAGGIFYPDDRVGDALKYTRELVRAAEANGVQFRWNEDVRAIDMIGGEGARLRGNQEVLAETKNVILAAGAYSAALARSAGVRLSVRPAKGYSITYPVDAIDPDERLDIAVVDDALHAAVTPLGNRLRVAGTAEFAGFDASLSQARLDNLRGLLSRILPRQAPLLVESSGLAWAGFRPMSARGWPVIGPTKQAGLYINSGHGPLGWTQAAGSGEALAQRLCGEPSELELDRYL